MCVRVLVYIYARYITYLVAYLKCAILRSLHSMYHIVKRYRITSESFTIPQTYLQHKEE
jgi:hypothetical protein